eukprot:GHVU01042027.1.p1 GENE.GHVU01042027.1~~GHVU01042027.1.p1  ORF type:complete len:112 (+),score=16.94 GHVU01042027.1:129-464(+)
MDGGQPVRSPTRSTDSIVDISPMMMRRLPLSLISLSSLLFLPSPPFPPSLPSPPSSSTVHRFATLDSAENKKNASAYALFYLLRSAVTAAAAARTVAGAARIIYPRNRLSS